MKKLTTVLWLALIISFAGISQLKGAPRKRIAILDFTTVKALESFANIARNKIELALYRGGRHDLLERKMVLAIIKEKKPELAACANTSCAVQIGELVSADYIVAGSIVNEGSLVVSVRVIDVMLGQVVYEESGEYDAGDQVSETAVSIGKTLGAAINEMVPGKPVILARDKFNRLHVTVSGGYSLPVSNFTKIVESNYTLAMQAGVRNLFIKNLYLAFESGYNRFPGKDTTEYAVIIPLMAGFGYYINIYRGVFILPAVSVGTAYCKLKQNDLAQSSFEPILRAGLFLGYEISPYFDIRVGGAYNNIFEIGDDMGFASVTIGVGVSY
ncbi:MAG: porin family protein [bacterium]|nr:porin family protein [bacterium]